MQRQMIRAILAQKTDGFFLRESRKRKVETTIEASAETRFNLLPLPKVSFDHYFVRIYEVID